MKVWLVTCLLLFALVQFYEWAKGFVIPLPIYVLAAAFLSIASNYEPDPNQSLNRSQAIADSRSRASRIGDQIEQ